MTRPYLRRRGEFIPHGAIASTDLAALIYTEFMFSELCLQTKTRSMIILICFSKSAMHRIHCACRPLWMITTHAEVVTSNQKVVTSNIATVMLAGNICPLPYLFLSFYTEGEISLTSSMATSLQYNHLHTSAQATQIYLLQI